MKADFEKGTKICSKCKRELSIEMFNKDNSRSDKLSMCCKDYTRTNAYGILIWYDGTLNELDSEQYHKIMCKEYTRQRDCAIRGYIGKVKPSEHFLFDFDLEQMLKDNVYCRSGKKTENT